MTDPDSPKPDNVTDRDLALVVLAAGGGTRMRSALPKPLHPVCGRPMVEHVFRAGAAADPVRSIAVVSPTTTVVPSILTKIGLVTGVVQDPPLGTGDAITQVYRSGAVDDARWVLILYADHPLLDGETVRRFVSGAREYRGRVSLLTCVLLDAGAYGRVARNDEGQITGIVERADDDPTMRLGPTEIWSGMMVLDAHWSRDALPQIRPSPQTGEYYLTELIGLAVDGAGRADSWPVSAVQAPPDVAYGVNDRVQLAAAEAVLRQRIRERHMLAGVTLRDPATTFIDDDVEIGADTTILPCTHLLNGTRVGRNCTIGPHATIAGSVIGNDVTVIASTITNSTVEHDTDVGPYSHLRGGTVIGPNSHIGNFAEMKNTRLESGVKAGHFSYLGDATVGAGTNIGAGTVTANYDGKAKHETIIGDGAFIGSDTVFRAPVRIGAGAVTGAGSVVTRDVAPGEMVVGVPARPVVRKPGTSDSERHNEGGRPLATTSDEEGT